MENLSDNQGNTEKRLDSIAAELTETRKEMGFYFATMMKTFDEGFQQLSSEIKNISDVQKEQLRLLEQLKERK